MSKFSLAASRPASLRCWDPGSAPVFCSGGKWKLWMLPPCHWSWEAAAAFWIWEWYKEPVRLPRLWQENSKGSQAQEWASTPLIMRVKRGHLARCREGREGQGAEGWGRWHHLSQFIPDLAQNFSISAVCIESREVWDCIRDIHHPAYIGLCFLAHQFPEESLAST